MADSDLAKTIWLDQQQRLFDFIVRILRISCGTYGTILLVSLILYLIRLGTRRRLKLERYLDFRTFGSSKNILRISILYDIFRICSNLLVCIVYIITNYRKSVEPWAVWCNRICSALFIIHMVGTSINSPVLFGYIISWRTFLSIFSVPSLILARGDGQFLHFGFLRAWQVYEAFANLNGRIQLRKHKKEQLIVRILVQLIILFYLIAGGIQLVEIPGDLITLAFQVKWNPINPDWTFFNAYYWVVVSLSTVGYGDISPNTFLGRIFAVLMIIGIIALYLGIVDELKKEAVQRKVVGKVPGRVTRHVVLTGSPTISEVQEFAYEFYSGDKSTKNSDSHIVVLMKESVFNEELWLSEIESHPLIQHKVTYIEGSSLDEKSLERAGILTATAVFLLTSHYSGFSFDEQSSDDHSRQIIRADTQSVMTALSIRNLRTDIPIFVQTILESSNLQIQSAIKEPAFSLKDKSRCKRPAAGEQKQFRMYHENLAEFEYEHLSRRFKTERDLRKGEFNHNRKYKQKDIAQSDLDRSCFVCIQQLFTALTAANLKTNGLSTLITNLFVEYEDENEASYKQHSNLPWLTEYSMGSECSLLDVIAPEKLQGHTIRGTAPHLFYYGIVIVGKRKENKAPKFSAELSVVSDINAELNRGDVLCVLTYLHIDHLTTIFNQAVEEYVILPKNELTVTENSGYVPLDNYLPTNELDVTENSGHLILVISGRTSVIEIQNFLQVLDKKDVENMKIVSQEEIKFSNPGEQRKFKRGQFYSKELWENAELEKASAVAILTDSSLEPDSADSQTIHTLLAIESMVEKNQNIFICSELVNQKSIKFLRAPKKNRRGSASEDANISQDIELSSEITRKEFYKGVRFPSGEIVIRSTADSLLVREFAEPGFIDFVKELIDAKDTDSDYYSPNDQDAVVVNSSENPKSSKVMMKRIPESIFGDAISVEYDVVFKNFISWGLIPVGLYRFAGSQVKYPSKKRWRFGKDIYDDLKKTSGSIKPNISYKEKYLERKGSFERDTNLEGKLLSKNKLPYVFTMPEPYTIVSKKDLIYVIGASDSKL